MRRLVVAMCVCLVVQSFAVSKECKLKTLEDKFTENSVQGTEPIFIFKKTNLAFGRFGFARDGADYLLYLVYQREFRRKKVSITEDTPMVITLENGEAVTVFPTIGTRAKRKNWPITSISKVLRGFYSIRREDVESLAETPVAGVVLNLLMPDGTAQAKTYEAAKPKYRARVMQNARCILDEDG